MGRELRTPVSYDEDFHRWTVEQARLLRSGQAAQADLANIAEELETLGRSEAAALRSSLRLIVLHLLNCRSNPNAPPARGTAPSPASATMPRGR